MIRAVRSARSPAARTARGPSLGDEDGLDAGLVGRLDVGEQPLAVVVVAGQIDRDREPPSPSISLDAGLAHHSYLAQISAACTSAVCAPPISRWISWRFSRYM